MSGRRVNSDESNRMFGQVRRSNSLKHPTDRVIWIDWNDAGEAVTSVGFVVAESETSITISQSVGDSYSADSITISHQSVLRTLELKVDLTP